MRVLVDTTIWSLALRRRRRALSDAQRELVREFEALVVEGRVHHQTGSRVILRHAARRGA